MPMEYVPDDAMTQMVSDMVGNEEYHEFAAVRQHEILFMVAAIRKTNKDDEAEPTSGDPVVIRKVPPADAVFMDGHYKVYIDGCRWDEANELQQKAMLHRALCRVAIETSESGKLILGTRKPDVVGFQQNIIRFGAWEEDLILLRNNLQNALKKAKQAAVDIDPLPPKRAVNKVGATDQ